ncbi:kinetochore-associated protein NSL1 homolog isoform X1 [Stigmatopora argus]
METRDGTENNEDVRVRLTSKKHVIEQMEQYKALIKQALDGQTGIREKTKRHLLEQGLADFEAAVTSNVSVSGRTWDDAPEDDGEPRVNSFRAVDRARRPIPPEFAFENVHKKTDIPSRFEGIGHLAPSPADKQLTFVCLSLSGEEEDQLLHLEKEMDDAIVELARKRRAVPPRIQSSAVRALRAWRELQDFFETGVEQNPAPVDLQIENAMKDLTERTSGTAEQRAQITESLETLGNQARGLRLAADFRPGRPDPDLDGEEAPPSPRWRELQSDIPRAAYARKESIAGEENSKNLT